MSTYLDYSYEPSGLHPVQCEYTATMYRGDKLETTQDGVIYCNDYEAAQAVMSEWNALSQKHRASIDGAVVWNYILKGQE